MKFNLDEAIQAISGKLPLETAPDFIRPVCVVSGDFQEMGRQYGQQQFLELRAMLLRTIGNLHKYGKIVENLAKWLKQWKKR